MALTRHPIQHSLLGLAGCGLVLLWLAGHWLLLLLGVLFGGLLWTWLGCRRMSLSVRDSERESQRLIYRLRTGGAQMRAGLE